MPLIIRLHSKMLEYSASSAMADPVWAGEPGPELPLTIDPDASFDRDMEFLLRTHYLNQKGQVHYKIWLLGLRPDHYDSASAIIDAEEDPKMNTTVTVTAVVLHFLLHVADKSQEQDLLSNFLNFIFASLLS